MKLFREEIRIYIWLFSPLFLIIFSLSFPFVPKPHILLLSHLFPPPVCLCPPSHQPTVVAGSPRRLLRSAGSGLQSREPVVVQLHAAGATAPGESPYPSSPDQGHLHGQTAPGRRGGRGGQGGQGCSGCSSDSGRIAVREPPSAWTVTWRQLACSLLLLSLVLLSPPPRCSWLFSSCWRASGMMKAVVKSSPN